MPVPTVRDVHVDAALTNFSSAFIQDADQFVAGRVFSVIPVQKKSDKYFEYDIGDWFRLEAKARAPGTEAAKGGWRLTTKQYIAERYSIADDVDHDEMQNADAAIRPLRDSTDYVTEQLLLLRENQWISAFFGTGTWTGSTSGSDITPSVTWDDDASTPIEDVRAQYVSIAKKTGKRPNTVVVGPEVWQQLVDHPDILDRVKYTRGIDRPADVRQSDLAALFNVDQFLVAWGVENTAAEQATDSMSFFAGKNALLAYSEPNPGRKKPSAGYTFAWQGAFGAGREGNRIRRFTMDELGPAERVEGDIYFDMKVVAADLGVFFSSVVA